MVRYRRRRCAGAKATLAAVEHLGYVQIDTINVVERCHHQILYTRIPSYQRADLHRAQTIDKTVFEYWTHAAAIVRTEDYPIHSLLMLAADMVLPFRITAGKQTPTGTA